MHGDAGDVAQRVANAHHELVAHELLGNDGDRLGHIAERRRGLGGARDDRNPVAGRCRHREVLVHTGDLQDEFSQRRARLRRPQNLRRFEKPVCRDRDGVATGIDRQRELAPLVGDRRRSRALIVRHRGNTRTRDRRSGRVEHAPGHDSRGAGLRRTRIGSYGREGNGSGEKRGEKGGEHHTTHETLQSCCAVRHRSIQSRSRMRQARARDNGLQTYVRQGPPVSSARAGLLATTPGTRANRARS